MMNDVALFNEEYNKQYFYHSDHLGSASLISDSNGDEYQRIEYTPYGETWVEKTQNTGLEFLPYKFTAKEQDEETGLYYYGARYLDSRYSRWISTDPALGDYMSGTEAGCGGIYNSTNLSLYHYAGNNPVKYTDPDGKKQNSAQKIFAKALNFAVTHSDIAASFIQSHTNVSITRNVYEGKEIHATWSSYNYDETETYYQDDLSIEVCGIPLNNIQVQSIADHPSGVDDTIPTGTKAKADVGKSGATKTFIKDTLLFDNKGDFLHPPAPGQIKPGSEGCVVTQNEADNREVMNILRDDIGIQNGNKQVNYSVKNSNWLRNIFRKENIDE